MVGLGLGLGSGWEGRKTAAMANLFLSYFDHFCCSLLLALGNQLPIRTQRNVIKSRQTKRLLLIQGTEELIKIVNIISINRSWNLSELNKVT